MEVRLTGLAQYAHVILLSCGLAAGGRYRDDSKPWGSGLPVKQDRVAGLLQGAWSKVFAKRGDRVFCLKSPSAVNAGADGNTPI
jgi:hypothetical protein